MGKYPMPLQEYLNRKYHVRKGSWRRPTDEKYAKPFHKKAADEIDFGTNGCKNGFHYFAKGGRCAYCKRTKKEIQTACD